jgi:hypothetical protein
MGRYISMAELSRHAIHMSETLQVASNTMRAVYENSILYPSSDSTESRQRRAVHGLRFSSEFLANLKLRADAFIGRLDNETQLVSALVCVISSTVFNNLQAYNIVSAYELQNTQILLRESTDKGRDLAQIVTLLTLLFLPGSFITVSQMSTYIVRMY